nr:hypothetical protein [Pseudomonas savastanoi]
MINQAGHLLARRTVYAFDCGVASRSIVARRDECITASAIGSAQCAVRLLQCLHLAFQRLIGAFHFCQQAQRTLHLAFLLFELPPEFVAVCRCLAAQQNVFPLLDLNLELQVGLINQLRGTDRTFKKTAIGLHVTGQEVETGQRNDQHQYKTTAKQAKDLEPQGFRHHDDLWRKAGLRQHAEYDELHSLRPSQTARHVCSMRSSSACANFSLKTATVGINVRNTSKKRQKESKRSNPPARIPGWAVAAKDRRD